MEDRITEHEVLEQALLPATVDPTVESLIANLDRGRAALQAATDDYQRLDLRDSARKAQVAAEILNRRDIAVQYSILILDAERAIAAANPAMTREQTGAMRGQPPAGDLQISAATLGRIRQAGSLPDDEYEKLKQEAVQRQEPLTQKSVIDAAKTLKNTAKQEEVQQRRKELSESGVQLPTGQYATVVIDPPWSYGSAGTTPGERMRGNILAEGADYPSMTVEELADLDLPLGPDAWVFLWTTNGHLPSAFQLLDSWELKYRYTMVWHKDGGPKQPTGPTYNAEFVLVASKGSPLFTDVTSFSTCFSAPRTSHSAKPEEFYELLRRVTPFPRLDMFNRRAIDGFDVWGDEASEE